MRRYGSLRRRAEFAHVQRRGKRRVGTAFIAMATEGRDRSRVGITVAKTVGNAVIRNRLRRRVKGILDRSGFADGAPRDVVLIARPGAGALESAALARELERLLG